MTGNDDHPLLEPANPCDATIGNEFPESDVSLEITGLKCCILTWTYSVTVMTVTKNGITCIFSLLHPSVFNEGLAGHKTAQR